MRKQPSELKNRDLYLKRLIDFQDMDPIKIITGIRGCGKTSLLRLMARHLRDTGVRPEQVIWLNLESGEFRGMDAMGLYRFVKERLPETMRAYLFLDEIQRVDQWEDAVNSFRVEFDCDIYVTGSNASLLSSKYATYLSGRYVEIRMLPLSFREFLDFHGYVVREGKSPTGTPRKRIYDGDGERCEPRELLEEYMQSGGMPGLADVGLDPDRAPVLLEGICSTVLLREVLERRGQLADPVLLREIATILAENIGNHLSIFSIANALANVSPPDKERRRPAPQTVQAYVAALLEAYMFYEVRRFDIRKKEYLQTLGKYYIADLGLRSVLLGGRSADTRPMLENIVFFELLRRGYRVAIGKVGNLEVDFIATTAKEKRYFQVTESMNDPAAEERELAPLRKIQDNWEKTVIAGLCDNTYPIDGIRIIRLTDFLLDGE